MFDSDQMNSQPASIKAALTMAASIDGAVVPLHAPSADWRPGGAIPFKGTPQPVPDAAEAPSGGKPAVERGGMADPERQLWCAVIIHTLYEASGRVAYAERGEHDAVRRAAIAWFEDAGEDFQAVCDLAGFLPAAIRDHAMRVIRGRRLPRIRISKAG